jgi:streptogrisin C
MDVGKSVHIRHPEGSTFPFTQWAARSRGKGKRVKLLLSGFVSASVLALGIASGVTATAAPETTGDHASHGRAASTDGLPAEVLVAMQRDLGLTPDQARRRVAQQTAAIVLDRTLQARLGAAFGGSWFDSASGKLVVAVTDAQRVSEVSKAGAQARVVKHSKATLDAVKAELDALAGKPATAGPATRAAGGQRQAAVDGLTGWYVDTITNSVVVSVLKTKPRPAALDGLARFGDAVRIEYTDVEPKPADPFMDGGDQIFYPGGGWCSAGFNLRNPYTGQGYLLTAGHCGAAGSAVSGHDGNFFGPVLEAWFPGYDDAIIRADNPGYWIQGPWVDLDPSHGAAILGIDGWSDSPPGTSVCKSGITTKLTCGVITAKDETVTYSGGLTVYGLTRHDACVEPGDSGGSNFTGTWAEGVTSGAQLYWDGFRYRCGQVFGIANVSWYFPFADSIPYYGAVYGVTLW